MTYLVTGAAGFIGTYVVGQLLDDGETVVGLDRQWPGATEMVLGAERLGDFDRQVGDVADLALMLRLVSDHEVTHVIHLAGELHALSADNPGQCITSNVIGTHNVLELGRLTDVERIVTASSAAVFGPPSRHPDGPIPEDASLLAADVYEASKIFGETEGAHYFRRFGVDNVALRIGLAFGYGSRIGWGARFVEELVVKPLRGEPGRVPWASSKMNWVYAHDAADAFVRASRVSTTDTFAYNIRGDLLTVAETVEAARELIPGADIAAEPGEHHWAQDFDDTGLRTETGYETRWTLRDGLADIIGRLGGEPAR